MTRSFIRSSAGYAVSPAEIAAALREALATDEPVEFFGDTGDLFAAPVFRLRMHGIGILVMDASGASIGAFADPMAAARYGYEVVDRRAAERCPPRRLRRSAAVEQPAPSVRSRRSTRATVTGERR